MNPNGPPSDPRLRWFEAIVCAELELPVHSFRHMLDSENGFTRSRIMDYLNGVVEDPASFFYLCHGKEANVSVLQDVPEEAPVASEEEEPSETEIVIADHDEQSPQDSAHIEEPAAADDAANGTQSASPASQPQAESESSPHVNGEEASPQDDTSESRVPTPKPPKKDTTPKKRLVSVRVPQLFFTLGTLPDASSVSLISYFLRNSNAAIATAASDEEQEAIMSVKLDRGVISNLPLATLSTVLTEVFLPVLAAPESIFITDQKAEDSKQPLTLYDISSGQLEGSGLESMRTEFLSNISKFASQMHSAVSQVTGDVRLRIPAVHIENPEVAAEDADLVMELDKAVHEWTHAISRMVESENGRKPRGKGPLAEIEYWRERNASFSALYEQLNLPSVKKIIQVLENEKGDTSMLPGFKDQYAELNKLYMEAKDNVKFLTTLERHFKNLSVGNLGTINETIPSMMNALRMVWIISRHYNTDERMVPLMERIAWEISEKVATAIDFRTILRKQFSIAKKRVEEGQAVLEKWKETYMAVRAKIENSGSHGRWEFDRKRLFERTSYMSDRCGDLLEIVEVLQHFRNILNNDLKSVTGESSAIDGVIMKVDGLIAPFESISFDVFDRSFSGSWEDLMLSFREAVTDIEETTRQFIDVSFKKLRSAEGAFALLQNFKNIESRASINKQMMEKFSDILEQFEKEIDMTFELFLSQKDNPPRNKNIPVLAGTIQWSRSLFYRIKKTMLQLQTAPDMMSSELGKSVTKKYINVGETVREYERKHFQSWVTGAESLATQCLKRPVVVERDGEYVVNFDPMLRALIEETKYLDRLGGLSIPDIALNVALQEEKYLGYIENLKSVVLAHKVALASLRPAEKVLLKDKVTRLTDILKPSLTTLNWNSLGIPDFITSTSKKIGEFQALIKQVQKNANTINSVVMQISNTVLVPKVCGIDGQVQNRNRGSVGTKVSDDWSLAAED
eukprot:ANDGO_02235.mRNA.1 Dynein-1-alpha heavy chain